MIAPKMKLSDYVVKFVESISESVFLLSGGAIIHLVDSISKSKKLYPVCCHHEQGATTAAEGFARIKNDIGVVVVTTGPGGTNAITGASGAWLDSIPLLIVIGQVKTDNITPRKNGVPVVRAIGFQELNVIDMVKPISKYTGSVERPEDIRYHLEKAVYLAKSGRPGPSWVEIPLDIQAADVDPKKLKGYSPPPQKIFNSKIPIDLIVSKLSQAKRPLLMAGYGIRIAGGVEVLWKLIKKLRINVITPFFTADDLVTNEYPYFLGRQGMPGNETANWAVDNCDLLLIIGERLQLTQTSFNYQNFATQALKIMVDIDKGEILKKTLKIDIPVHCDAKIFLEKLYQQKISLTRWNVKVKLINANDYQGNKKYLNIYKFLEKLNKETKGYHVATANGLASILPHQKLEIKKGQRFITNAGLGQMGSGLPLAIGACLASDKKPVICMEGDGSLMLNLQELQTVLHHKLPIKLFIYNNNGYYSIRSTHLNYFKRVFAADPDTGVSLPNYEKLIKAWGFKYIKIANDSQLDQVKKVIDYQGPVVCELMMDPNQPLPEKWSAGMYRDKSLCKISDLRTR